MTMLAGHQQNFTDIFILWLSGVDKSNNNGEIICGKNDFGQDVTVDFPAKGPRHAITRSYDSNGNKSSELEWINGGLKLLIIYDNFGNKILSREFQDGLQHGKEIIFYKNGDKKYQQQFKKDKPFGKVYRWNKDGKPGKRKLKNIKQKINKIGLSILEETIRRK